MSLSSQPNENTLEARRRRAGDLLNAVFDEALTPRQAINQWPCLPGQPEPDLSIAAAYQALWHFEADETQQQTTVFYLDVQLDVLLSMARMLSQGLELPEELLAHYGQSEVLPSLEKRAETDPAVDAPIEFGMQSFLKWLITQWHAYRHRLQRRLRQIQHTWHAVWKPFERKK